MIAYHFVNLILIQRSLKRVKDSIWKKFQGHSFSGLFGRHDKNCERSLATVLNHNELQLLKWLLTILSIYSDFKGRGRWKKLVWAYCVNI